LSFSQQHKTPISSIINNNLVVVFISIVFANIVPNGGHMLRAGKLIRVRFSLFNAQRLLACTYLSR